METPATGGRMKHATARRIEDEIDSLKDMSTNELVERFVELHGY